MKIVDEAGNGQARAPVAQREPRTQGGAPLTQTQEEGCLFFRAKGKLVRAWGSCR